MRYSYEEAKLLDIEETNIPTYQPRQQRSTASKPPKKLTYAVIPKKEKVNIYYFP